MGYNLGYIRIEMKQVKFEQGNQLRLDVTREELFFMKMSLEASVDECRKEGSIVVTKIYTKLLKKVKETSDLLSIGGKNG